MITDIARESKLPGPSAESKRVCVSMCLYITFLTSKDLKKSRVKSAQLLEDWTPVKSLIRPAGPVLFGWPHLNDVYIQWKVRERENDRERKSIGTEFYYIGMTDKKKKQTSLPANYISVWVIFLPLPTSSSVLAPIEFSVLWELGYHFHFIASVTYKKKERNDGLAAILPKLLGSPWWLEGPLEWAGADCGWEGHVIVVQVVWLLVASFLRPVTPFFSR